MNSAGTRYLVCSVPRSGSTLFCHLLRSTGRLGMQPFDGGRFEYLVPYLRGRFKQVDWSSTGLFDLLEIPFGSSATSNGVMGFKVMWDQFDRLLETARTRGRDRGMSRTEAESRLASRTRFVWLRRRDGVRQAVSWAKALQSNAWNSRVQREFRGRYLYDFPGITLALRRIHAAEAAWQGFFDRWGVTPLTLYYEDYLVDRDAAVRSVAEGLGVAPVPVLDLQADPIEVQSDGVNLEWERRYREDSRSALTSVRAMAVAVASPAWWSTYAGRLRHRPTVPGRVGD